MASIKLRDGDNDSVYLADSVPLIFGSGADINDAAVGDVQWQWDGTDFDITFTTADSGMKWGVDGAGVDQIWYGDTAGSNMTWDQSADSLIFTDSTPVKFGDSSDVTLQFDATNLVLATAVADTGALALGADDAGVDVIFFGDTAGSKITWDQSADSLLITDSTPLSFGDSGDLTLQFDATNLVLATTVDDTGAFVLGADDLGVDLILYGATAGSNCTWDQSADSLILTDATPLVFGDSSDANIAFDATRLVITPAAAGGIMHVGDASDTAANELHIFDGGTDKPGAICLYDHAGTARYLWIDNTGDVRTHTAMPADGDSDGTIVGTQA